MLILFSFYIVAFTMLIFFWCRSLGPPGGPRWHRFQELRSHSRCLPNVLPTPCPGSAQFEGVRRHPNGRHPQERWRTSGKELLSHFMDVFSECNKGNCARRLWCPSALKALYSFMFNMLLTLVILNSNSLVFFENMQVSNLIPST